MSKNLLSFFLQTIFSGLTGCLFDPRRSLKFHLREALR